MALKIEGVVDRGMHAEDDPEKRIASVATETGTTPGCRCLTITPVASRPRASAKIPLGCLIGDQSVLHDAEANQRGLSWREGSKESPGLDHSGVEIGSMYVVTLCSRRFAMVIRAIKKLDSKCRHPGFLSCFL